jgi:hypothetical protein
VYFALFVRRGGFGREVLTQSLNLRATLDLVLCLLYAFVLVRLFKATDGSIGGSAIRIPSVFCMTAARLRFAAKHQ